VLEFAEHGVVFVGDLLRTVSAGNVLRREQGVAEGILGSKSLL